MNAFREKTSGNYSRSMPVYEINDETLEYARCIFEEYHKKGILLNDSFDDDVWKITDEKSVSSLMLFKLDSAQIKPWLGCAASEFRKYVKAFVAFNLGEAAVFTLQGASRDLLRLAGKTSEEAAAVTKNLNHIVSFLQIIPDCGMERDWVIERLSDAMELRFDKQKNGKQRILAEFQSYMRFNDALSDFWRNAGNEEKLFYFPLYLWWNLTAVLPLRVTEFLLTPRDCLKKQNGEYSITVRRSKLKSSDFSRVSYRIAEDYQQHTYGISGSLAHEIEIYLNATAKMPRTGLGTLLLTQPHYKYMGITPLIWGKRYYSYRNLLNCMQYFYRNVIEPNGLHINPIKLGDTRHIAMISLVISGGSPVICRELAGHSDINISSHYYSNISTLVECATLERYRKSKMNNETVIVGEQKYPLEKPNAKYRVAEGYCSSDSFPRKDVTECLKAVGNGGQIGDCNVCPYYLPDRQGVRLEFMNTDAGKAAVDADSRYLMQMVELVRKGIGCTEDIGAVLLKLQHSGNHYAKCLWEDYENGKTEKIK